jgi:competence ComEA-like helix-hairpin-helix protein
LHSAFCTLHSALGSVRSSAICYLLTAICSLSLAAGTQTLTVIATNDLHGELLSSPDWTVPGTPKPELGGLARLAAFVDSERARGPCLVLDAGDFLSGSPEANRTRGMAMIELMNRIGYDAAAVGERDIPFLTEKLDTIARHAKFRLMGERALSLTANVDMPVTRPSLLKDVAGIKVGIIGLLDEALARTAGGVLTDMDAWLTAEQSLYREIKSLRSANAELIVVLAHMPIERCRRLAAKYREPVLFICGHEGLVVEPTAQDSPPLIVETGRRGQRVAVCRIYFDSARHSVVRIRSHATNLLADRLREDSALAGIVADYGVPGMEDSVGSCPEELTPLLQPGSYSQLGRFAALALKKATGTDIAILPTAVLDWALPQGTVTRRSACRAIPFDDPLVRVKLNDLEIAEALNEALSWSTGHSAVVAGLNYNIAVPDSQHPLTRATDIRADREAPSHNVLLTRELAASAGIPGKRYTSVKETPAELLIQAIGKYGIAPSALRAFPVAPSRSADSGKVNINTATSEQLKTLRGIGTSLAKRIIEYRQQTGSFQRIEDIMKVKGIKQGLFSRIRDRITI